MRLGWEVTWADNSCQAWHDIMRICASDCRLGNAKENKWEETSGIFWGVLDRYRLQRQDCQPRAKLGEIHFKSVAHIRKTSGQIVACLCKTPVFRCGGPLPRLVRSLLQVKTAHVSMIFWSLDMSRLAAAVQVQVDGVFVHQFIWQTYQQSLILLEEEKYRLPQQTLLIKLIQ